MSAIAVIYERTDTPVDPGLLERVMDRLRHRGPDGSDVIQTGYAALGHWHFWTTPEEVGERQPLELKGLPFKIVLDGRLDNRPELFSKLGIELTEGNHLSDAALILRAYDRWGEDCFAHFVGEFAFAILDQRRRQLVCARDPLGDRALFYSFHGTRLVIASEPWAAAASNGSSTEINEYALAHFFALKASGDGQTLFKDVYELLPAHAMIVTAQGVRKWRYWQPDPTIHLRGRSDAEYAVQFRELLDESVRCRLRSTTPVGVLMSGGLDSSSIACLAARMLSPTPVTTISYVFDELKDCDERKYIETMIARWGVRSLQIPCDDAWPFRDWADWPRNPNLPESNPYRLLKERAYQRAHTEGLRVLMPGAFGDELYDGEEDWLADLIAERRLREAGRELMRHLRYAGLRPTLKSSYVRRVGSRWFHAILGRGRLQRRQTAPAWLTSFSREQLEGDLAYLDPAFEHKRNILSLEAARSSSAEIFHASRHSLELRHPYRDRRLVEFVLSLPAHQLYNRGYFKYILRNAMWGTLPDAILSRQGPTPLLPLFSRGMERERDVVQTCVKDARAVWRKYVRADWLMDRLEVPLTPETDGPEAVVPWLCISTEAWFRSANIADTSA